MSLHTQARQLHRLVMVLFLQRTLVLVLRTVEPTEVWSICKVFKKKRALQWYSKCYYVASVTKMFALKEVQIIHRSTPCVIIGSHIKP
jgi:hypothetical protein